MYLQPINGNIRGDPIKDIGKWAVGLLNAQQGRFMQSSQFERRGRF